jgi:hypothetical protein
LQRRKNKIVKLFFRWIQIARRIISKSRRDSNSGVTGGGGGRPPSLPSRNFNGSENDLRLNYNSVPTAQYSTSSGQYGVPSAPGPYRLPAGSRSVLYGGRDGIRFSPDGGRLSPEVQVYKTRVIYHSKQERADHHSSV